MDGPAEYKKEVWWWIEWKVFLCAWLSVRGKWGEKVGFQVGAPSAPSWTRSSSTGRHPLHHHPAGAARIWWERQPGDLSTQMHVVWKIRGKCGVFEEWLLLRRAAVTRRRKCKKSSKKISLWTRDDSVSKFEYCINLLTWNLLFALPWIYEKLKLNILEGV